MSTISNHKLTRMKKGDIIKLFRETEKKLFGYTASAEKAVVEIEELNERIDDYMIQEAMNVKTINELNESNKKLMEKVKFYQQQKENNKRKENKVADYLNNGLIEKVELLEKEKEELQGEINRHEDLSKQRFIESQQVYNDCCERIQSLEKEKEDLIHKYEDQHNYSCEMGDFIDKQKEEKDKLKEKVELLEKEKEELIEECKEKNKWNEKLQDHHDCSNERMQIYMGYLFNMENQLKNLRVNDEEILKSYAKPKTIDSNINQWITDCCEECENIKDGIIEVAPTELDNLYCDFKEWAQREEIDAPKRYIFKENLKIWQKNSRFGLQIGEKKSDAGFNGYEAKSRFNLKVI